MTVADVVQVARRHAAVQYALDAQADSWDSDATASAPPPGEAAKRGYAAINQFVAQRHISAGIAARGKELIKFLFKPNTVDASISTSCAGPAAARSGIPPAGSFSRGSPRDSYACRALARVLIARGSGTQVHTDGTPTRSQVQIYPLSCVNAWCPRQDSK